MATTQTKTLGTYAFYCAIAYGAISLIGACMSFVPLIGCLAWPLVCLSPAIMIAAIIMGVMVLANKKQYSEDEQNKAKYALYITGGVFALSIIIGVGMMVLSVGFGLLSGNTV